MFKKPEANPIETPVPSIDDKKTGQTSGIISIDARRAMHDSDLRNHLAESGKIEQMFRRPRRLFTFPTQNQMISNTVGTIKQSSPSNH